MSTAEFVALIAMLFSVVAFSVDAMLPAFPQMEADLGPGARGRVHYVVTLFMAGLGLGTLFAGPISDAIGRRRTMFIGAGLYIGAGLVAWLAQSVEVIFAARFVQGLGAAGPRVVSLAIVRDLYKGRQMAQIVSFALVLFTIVPALAPAMGAALTDWFGWRAIFLAFLVFMTIAALWMYTRLSEPLPMAERRAFQPRLLMASAQEILGHPAVRLAILVQMLAMSMIFSLLVMVQPIYDQVFGEAENFPYWFGGIALVSAAGTSLTNAYLVMRVGMIPMITMGIAGQVLFAALALTAISLVPEMAFYVFVAWQFLLIWMTGFCIGNLNAIAMEPMGHIAGFTASVTGAVSTLGAAAIATGVGLQFDGTPRPLLIAVLVLALMAFPLMLRLGYNYRHTPARPIEADMI